jgi:hypothetical protein
VPDLITEEDQARLAFVLGRPILELREGALLRIIVLRKVSVMPSKNANVNITIFHIAETSVERTLVFGDVILHRDIFMV